jgi:hypothetical protein
MSQRVKRRIYGDHTYEIHPRESDGTIYWNYVGENFKGGGHVSVDECGSLVTVSTDDYEGTAMFPVVLLPEVLRELRLVLKAVRTAAQKA